jgi:hypothetical protein
LQLAGHIEPPAKILFIGIFIGTACLRPRAIGGNKLPSAIIGPPLTKLYPVGHTRRVVVAWRVVRVVPLRVVVPRVVVVRVVPLRVVVA